MRLRTRGPCNRSENAVRVHPVSGFRSVILLLGALMRGYCKYNWHLFHIAIRQGAVVKLLTVTLGGHHEDVVEA